MCVCVDLDAAAAGLHLARALQVDGDSSCASFSCVNAAAWVGGKACHRGRVTCAGEEIVPTKLCIASVLVGQGTDISVLRV